MTKKDLATLGRYYGKVQRYEKLMNKFIQSPETPRWIKHDTFFWLTLIAFVIGMLLGAFIQSTTMKREAINHGAAHYDTKTGSWEWNNKEEKK